MKLDKMKFAKVVAHCVQNGLSQGDWEIERLDELIEFEVEQPKNVVPFEAVDELLRCMAGGTEKIQAIKAYRTLTGVGLKESKDAVEKYWVSKPVSYTPPNDENDRN